MSRLVLDLRDNQPNTPDGLRLTNAVASGTVAGYRVESQLRSRHAVKGLSMRLTAPDGRFLDVVGEPGVSPDNAKSPVTGALAPQVGYAFRARPTPTQQSEAVRAIDAVITEGHACLDEGVSGYPARIRIQCAALDLDHTVIAAFLDEHEQIRATDPILAQFPDRPRHSDLAPIVVGWLLEAGFTPDDVQDYWYTRNFGGRKHVLAKGDFRRNGWTQRDIDTLRTHLIHHEQRRNPSERVWVPDADVDTWRHVPVREGLLAARVGLTVATTRRMLRDGTYDEAALEMLAGLLANPLDPSTGVLELVG